MIGKGLLFHARRAMIVLMSLLANDPPRAQGAETADIEPARARFASLVAAELAQGILPGVSVSWVVDGQIVHSTGYGQADWTKGLPAKADTIYRAGSISKLLNAVAAMQLVEQGRLDLDAPISRVLPGFSIVVPFDDAPPITARQLLCHRSGMIREAPVGGYFDAAQPSVAQTVASVADCVLVNRPNSKTRYSNVGPTIVGRALEVQSGISYADYQQKHVLGPLGMHSSAWLMNDALRPRLAAGRMRIAQGDGSYADDVAPQFELGTIPSGNLYTTADDLARFAIWVMNLAGAANDGGAAGILRPESLAEICRVQLTGEPNGFGLGFMVGRHQQHRSLSHMGAVYGFTSSWCVLPDERIGVVVLANADIAIAPVKRLSDASLDLLLAAMQSAKAGNTARTEIPAETPPAAAPNSESLERFAGDYESAGYWAHLAVRNGALAGEFSGQPIALAQTGPLKFQANGRIMLQQPFEFQRGEDGRISGFSAVGQSFRRVDESPVTTSPEAWKHLVGCYGPPYIPLVIAIRHGHLYATLENEYDYRLTPENRVSFALPPGMYADERIVFQLDSSGKVTGAVMANMVLPRRAD